MFYVLEIFSVTLLACKFLTKSYREFCRESKAESLGKKAQAKLMRDQKIIDKTRGPPFILRRSLVKYKI
jgi:hypothetical protein